MKVFSIGFIQIKVSSSTETTRLGVKFDGFFLLDVQKIGY